MKKQSVDLKGGLRKMRKDLRNHFKKDGWDLDYLVLVSDLIFYSTGINWDSLMIAEARKMGLEFSYDSTQHQFLISKPKKKRAKNDRRRKGRKK